jgi:hypothetical protein
LSTEDLIDELVQMHNGWNRDGVHGCLRYLNEAHNILMSAESQQTTIFDTATGKLPPLNTTSGTFFYTMLDDVWRVSAILIQINPLYGYPFAPQFDYGMNRLAGRSSPENSLVIGGIQYSKVPFIRTRDRINSTTPATIMWTKDPETKTDFYYRLSYRTPVQILSESIQPEIPSPLDVQVLLPTASKLIEGAQKFNIFDAYLYIEKELKPKLWKELDAGDQGDLDMESVSRGF